MKKQLSVPIIGRMHSAYVEKFGIPRQPNLVNSMSYIEMLAPYDDVNAFVGLTEFSHIWLLWQFHQNKRDSQSDNFQPLIRPPRLGGNQKIGVFASRSMYRPAAIGLSVVQFVELRREQQQTRVYVKGADLLDGTPIIDIKPYLNYADCVVQAISGYAQQQPPSLPVSWSVAAQQQRQQLLQQIDPTLLMELEAVLAQNPKPAYQQDANKIYGLRYAALNVKFKIEAQQVLIVALECSGK
jgi:tRNA-Thr(GGU) m(6)t(6)A37 methyltransferase TsaA